MADWLSHGRRPCWPHYAGKLQKSKCLIRDLRRLISAWYDGREMMKSKQYHKIIIPHPMVRLIDYGYIQERSLDVGATDL